MLLSPEAARVYILNVAVFAPLRQCFDYRFDGDRDELVPAIGARVWVPFGRSQRVGVVLAWRESSATEVEKLKAVLECLDDPPLLTAQALELAAWSARYYQHPPGDVIAAMLPTWLRRRRGLPVQVMDGWTLTEHGEQAVENQQVSGERQVRLLRLLSRKSVTSAAVLADEPSGWRPVMRRLLARGWVEQHQIENDRPSLPQPVATTTVALNEEQQAAANLIETHVGGFKAIVLQGVTGSGKTEVYLEAITQRLAAAQQALVLVPEIALTKQLVARFQDRFGNQVGVIHSALSDRERALTWDACRRGQIGVLIGTRSAVWSGVPNLGLIVVDEEHDSSYKQQDGFRYSARDIAIVRAQLEGVPVVLGSATPALETLANVERGKFLRVRLDQRAQAAAMPRIHCVDVRGLQLIGGLGHHLVTAMREHLARGEQVMLFLNRRGYAPLLICRSCGELRRCDRCDAYLVYHKHINAARCHHCDSHRSLRWMTRCCEAEETVPIGLGTEQLEEAVRELFPEHNICRIDRDSVRRVGALDEILQAVAEHRIDILIGTQMVAKGLDFADITLVGVVDADSRLHSIDFRAEERLAQLLIQVAGRAGRAAKAGTVLVQTHQPEHSVLQRIIADGYEAYARVALQERRETQLPPYAAMAIVRAESPVATRPSEFLQQVRNLLLSNEPANSEISYPLPALMERRAGRYRALIVIRNPHRAQIGRILSESLLQVDALARKIRVRWSLDIDPQDTL